MKKHIWCTGHLDKISNKGIVILMYIVGFDIQQFKPGRCKN